MKITHVKRNHFEMAAHNMEVTRKGQRPSFPNTWPEGVKEGAALGLSAIVFTFIVLAMVIVGH